MHAGCLTSAAVFDGHGGFAAAEYLQQHLYRIFTRVLDAKGVEQGLDMSQDVPGLACPLPLAPVLTDSFHHADEDLLGWMHGAPLPPSAQRGAPARQRAAALRSTNVTLTRAGACPPACNCLAPAPLLLQLMRPRRSVPAGAPPPPAWCARTW